MMQVLHREIFSSNLKSNLQYRDSSFFLPFCTFIDFVLLVLKKTVRKSIPILFNSYLILFEEKLEESVTTLVIVQMLQYLCRFTKKKRRCELSDRQSASSLVLTSFIPSSSSLRSRVSSEILTRQEMQTQSFLNQHRHCLSDQWTSIARHRIQADYVKSKRPFPI